MTRRTKLAGEAAEVEKGETSSRLAELGAALDERRIDDWLAMIDQDIIYQAPIRLTRTGPNRDRDVMRTMFHFDENYDSLQMRSGRLQKSAWAEDPPSRCRRFVTNVRVAECETPGEYEVVSYLFLERSRGDLSPLVSPSLGGARLHEGLLLPELDDVLLVPRDVRARRGNHHR